MNLLRLKAVTRMALASTTLLFGAISCSTDSRAGGSQPSPDSAAMDSLARAAQDSINRTLPGYVVDSILPVEEELRRFRAAVGSGKILTLEGGASSRDSLLAKFLDRLQASDTTSVKGMLLSASEFAWLVYPESPYSKPPYTQAPALVWDQIQNHSRSGLLRLVRRLAGHELHYAGYSCSRKVEIQGNNKIWAGCTVRIGAPGESVRDHRLFGSIIERGGQFKFVSFANEF